MTRIVTMLLAAFALWVAAPSLGHAQGTHGCACLHNRVGQPINFQFRWGNQPFQSRTLLPGNVFSFCWAYGTSVHSSPPLQFLLDRDAGPGTAFTAFTLTRVQSLTTQCSGVPRDGHHFVAFQPGTGNQILMVGRGFGPATATPASPQPPPGAQSAFGCACVNNGIGGPVQFQYRWGNQPFNARTLLPGRVYAFCWPYGAGPHTSPPLQFMLNRAIGGAVAFTNYALNRVQSPTNQCAGVPRAGQYWVRFQPGTGGQFLHVSRN
jgi:hypothetical protein